MQADSLTIDFACRKEYIENRQTHSDKEEIIMNLTEKYAPIATKLSIGQYCPPKCFELSGKQFRFIMDTGEETGDITLDFKDETTVAFSVQNGKRAGEAKYECRK